MSYGVLSALLVAHFIADYPLQTNWMADGKHEKDHVLFAHALMHSIVTYVLVYIISQSLHLSVGFGSFAFVSHFLIDAVDLHIRWDQTVHLVTIVFLWATVMGVYL